jgi:peptidoglycan hydrolase-like protein with peptidoglycan-binding domain
LHRDLSRSDVWEHSLERSRARRAERGRAGAGRFTRPAPQPGGSRDLSDPELWRASRARSRRRHDAEEPTFELPARGASVAALLLVTGGSATAVASSLSGGGDGDTAAAKPRERAAAPATPAPAVKRAPQAGVQAEPARAPKAVVRTAAAVTTPRPAPRPGGVPDLQKALGVQVDGSFGPATRRALKAWQRKNGLTPDGVAGPETRRALGLGAGPVLKWQAPPRRAARPRSRPRPKLVAAKAGGGVRALQLALGVPADGVFGPGTERALKRWQRSHGLAADGVAGPQTRSRLGIGPGAVLKRKAAPRQGGSGRGGPTGGGDSSVVARVVAAANAIAGKPYVYGGGHGSFDAAGYDCSGSVSYALHGGGLLSTPLDSSGFMSYGAPGPGRRITIYANPGHVYMTIDGRRFDTSARSETGSRWTGTSRSQSGYVVRHPPGY